MGPPRFSQKMRGDIHHIIVMDNKLIEQATLQVEEFNKELIKSFTPDNWVKDENGYFVVTTMESVLRFVITRKDGLQIRNYDLVYSIMIGDYYYFCNSHLSKKCRKFFDLLRKLDLKTSKEIDYVKAAEAINKWKSTK